MNVKRLYPVMQMIDEVQELAIKNNTTKSVCGYISCAICQFLAEQSEITHETFKQIDFPTLKPYIEKVMKTIAKSRRLEIKKFMSKMNESQRKSHMTDWVANYEVVDYLDSITDKSVNPFLYMFRQCGLDHPEALENIKYEEAERLKEEVEFKGEGIFYSSFNPKANHFKQEFVEEVKKNHGTNFPMIISTDVLGHFNTTVLFDGRIYVLDSLPYVEGQYDGKILEAIAYYYQISYLKQ